ncbi:NAD(P)/FAD-dependent oxidoreductase [Aquincola sp. MAHUQ-54]|uniref:NAD(P)/FAD-dependent oxidoreductase n=1 Tax=Aquincola agrisoli TaxID=3119538 RepID=A0AAW9Q8P6_9BURK
MRRRLVLGGFLAGGAAALAGCAAVRTGAPARVVVVGGGFGGATAAKYLRLLSGQALDVVLVEPQPAFVSCPLSNLVVGGLRQLADLTRPYAALHARHGVTRVQDTATAVDVQARTLRLARGAPLHYDKLLLSPGIDLMFDDIPGLAEAQADGLALQAWKAGPETAALHRQLASMRDGGVFAITVPEAPYRCPPGPYERASVVAAYLKVHKPRSKVLILDANDDVTSKGPLFKQAWRELYGGMVEYRPQHQVAAVDGARRTIRFAVHDDVAADVLNVLPPMRAGVLAVQAGLANANGRWCRVDFRSFASTAARHVHVIGDAIQAAPLMPKSGHMANAHAKVAAAAIVAELAGLEPDPGPMLTNTCYSFVGAEEAIHVASVHAYADDERTFKTVPGSGGVSAARSAAEGRLALAWAQNIWADMLE